MRLTAGDYVKRFYNGMPLPLKRLLEPIASSIRTIKLLRVDLWKVEGTERSSHLPLSVISGLKRQHKHYVFGCMFDDGYREEYIGKSWIWNLNRGAITNRACGSILVAELRKRHRWLLRKEGFWIPGSVKGEVVLPLDLAGPGCSSVKSDLRRIRKNGLTYEVTRDDKKLEYFYQRMYVPHIESAHSDGAYIMSFEDMKREFPLCELLLVKQKELVIGGILLFKESKRPRLGSLGVLDGNHEYLRAGVISALFHYSFQWLTDKGATSASTGASRAFLCDGVLRYKKKLQQRITEVSPGGLFFLVLSPTPGAEAFLCANPFISESGSCLRANVFIASKDELTADVIRQAEKDFLHPGLKSVHFHCLDEELKSFP